MNRFACAAVALVLLQMSHAMATTITIATDAGTVKIESLARDIDVDIKGNGDIDITDQSTGSKVLVRAGEYKFELKGNKNDTKLEASDFRLLREGKPILRITSKQTVRPKGTQSLAKEVIGWYEADGGREMIILPGEKKELVCVMTWGNGAPPSLGKLEVGKKGELTFKQPRDSVELSAQRDGESKALKSIKVLDVEFTKRLGAKEALGAYKSEKGQTMTISEREGQLYCSIDWANGAPKTNGFVRAGASGKTMLVGTNWEDELTLGDKEGELERVGLIGIEFVRTETE